MPERSSTKAGVLARPRSRSAVVAALAAVLAVVLVTLALPGGAAPAEALSPPPPGPFERQEQRLVRRMNNERRERDLRRLRIDGQLTEVAREWTEKMAARDRLAHNPRFAQQIRGSWVRVGENVGYTVKTGATKRQLVRRLHRAFMRSPSHRDNILGKFNRVGVGIVVARDGTMWVTVNFSKV